MRTVISATMLLILIGVCPSPVRAWHDETHVAIAKAAGYKKWFNAAGADMLKIKAGWIEKRNHHVNNPRGAVVTVDRVFDQVDRYDQANDAIGHLYGAIIASIRDYIRDKKSGKYGEYHLAFAAHYIGDLSQPLHNTAHTRFNQTHHHAVDHTINDTVMDNIDRIRIYDISIASERDLAREIARIANLSRTLGYRLHDEKRLLTAREAYQQVGHSASLFKAVLRYVAGKV